ncbi:MAG: hypothetical protein J6D08_00495 [Lachnospiraceae bacterium]|nr:hypothetical protein [Lachnospiraceae bacterium]
MPDVYDSEIPFEDIRLKTNRFCFTGGMNNRNWKLVAQIAKELKNLKFICVALKADFESQVNDIPSNLKVYYNIPSEQYYDLMRNSYLVLLPLLDNRVAGFINIIRAAQYGVPCMTTKTLSTEQYYTEDLDLLMPNDQMSVWVGNIKKWYQYGDDEYMKNTKYFYDYIESNFSPQNAARKIMKLIKEFD